MEGAAEIKRILSPRLGVWAKSDAERLLVGLKFFGKDYDRLTKYVGVKTKTQVYDQVKKVHKHYKANPNLDDAKEILSSLEEWIMVFDSWSEVEHDLLFSGLMKYGKDYGELAEIFQGTRTRKQIA